MAESFLPPVVAVLQADAAPFLDALAAAKEGLAQLAESGAVLDDLSASFDKVTASGEAMATSLEASSKLAADSFKVVLDAATELGAGIVEPLDAAKTSIRGLASALRALAKTAAATDDEGQTAMEQIAASAKEMGISISNAAGGARTSLAELGATFKTTAGESAAAAASTETSVADLGATMGAVGTEAEASAATVTAAAERSATAATTAGDAAAASSEKSAAAMSETAGGLMKYATGLAAAGFGVFEAIKSATNFQASMTRLSTQAGLTSAQLQQAGLTSKQLANTVLNMGTQFGFTGTEMAQALYHPISAGLDLKSALIVTADAAKEAQISGANLEDTTYTLSSVMKAFNYSAAQATPTMAALNAIVGNGDTTFQALNDSIKTWAPTAATFGVSLNSVGAALDYMTDRGDSADTAGTKLSMMMALMVGQSKQAASIMVTLGMNSTQVTAATGAMAQALQKAGVTQGRMANDLKQPDGLYVALNDLQDHLRKAGLSANETNSLLVKAFGGGKNFKGVTELMDNLGGLKDKFDQLSQGGSVQQWQDDWTKASGTLKVQWDQLKSGLENLGTKIGTVLIPPLEKVLGYIRSGVGWIAQHKQAVDALAAVLGGVLVGALWAVAGAVGAALAPLLGVEAAIAAVAAIAIYAYTHFKPFHDVVNDVARVLKTVLVGALQIAEAAIKGLISWFEGHKQIFIAAWDAMAKAVQTVAKWLDQNVISWIKARIADLVAWWSAHGQEIAEVWSAIWSIVKTVVKIWWDGYMRPLLTTIESVWRIAWGAIKDTIKLVWDLISGVITGAMHFIMNYIGLVLDIITGKWGKVWGDLKKLVGDAFHDMLHLIGSVASDFGSLLYDAGANIIKGLINGIESMIGSVGNVMGDITSEIKNFLPWSPAKKGPLSGNGAPTIGGRNIAKQIAQGLALGTVDVSAAMTKVSSVAAGGLAVRAPAFAGAAASGGAYGANAPIVINNNIAGSVVSERQLRDLIEKLNLQRGGRNSQTYQSAKK